ANSVEGTNSLGGVLSAIERGDGLLGQIVKNREQGSATLGDLQKTIAHVERTAASLERMAGDVEAGKGAFGVLLRRGDDVERLLRNLQVVSGKLATLSGNLESAQG